MRFFPDKFIPKAYSRHLANARGITLMELLVAAGLMALVAAGVGTGIYQVVTAQREIEKKFDSSEFVASLARTLTDRASCRSSLSGITIPNNTDFKDLTLNNYIGFGDAPGTPLKSGHVVLGAPANPQVVVKDLSWRLKDPINPAANFRMTLDGVTATYQKATMQMRVQLATYNNGKETVWPYRYLDYSVVVLASTGVVTDCAGNPSVADTCNMIGAAVNADGTCAIDSEGCVIRGSYVQSFCSPTGIRCRATETSPPKTHPETKAYACPAGSTPFSSFNYSWTSEEKTGKKSDTTVTNNIKAYMCMSCH